VIVTVVAGEEELGAQRLCTDCHEWWPDTDEFFGRCGRGQYRQCRACRKEERTGLRERPDRTRPRRPAGARTAERREYHRLWMRRRRAAQREAVAA
jgi:hypothetical protein